MRHRWFRDAFAYGGAPILFCSLLYGTLGLIFLFGSLFLDPIMATAVAILLATGLAFPTIFVIVAYFHWGELSRISG